jgi:hypothetical protein
MPFGFGRKDNDKVASPIDDSIEPLIPGQTFDLDTMLIWETDPLIVRNKIKGKIIAKTSAGLSIL